MIFFFNISFSSSSPPPDFFRHFRERSKNKTSVFLIHFQSLSPMINLFSLSKQATIYVFFFISSILPLQSCCYCDCYTLIILFLLQVLLSIVLFLKCITEITGMLLGWPGMDLQSRVSRPATIKYI